MRMNVLHCYTVRDLDIGVTTPLPVVLFQFFYYPKYCFLDWFLEKTRISIPLCTCLKVKVFSSLMKNVRKRNYILVFFYNLYILHFDCHHPIDTIGKVRFAGETSIVLSKIVASWKYDIKLVWLLSEQSCNRTECTRDLSMNERLRERCTHSPRIRISTRLEWNTLWKREYANEPYLFDY